MADSMISDSKGTASSSGNEALASQKELVEYNLKLNTAFAWLQTALDAAKKIKG